MKTRTPYHRLIEVDEVFHTAICSQCSVVDIFLNYNKAWTCISLEGNYRKNRRRRLYGLNELQMEIIEKATNCDLCRTPFKNEKDKHVDHDHETKKFRGILCQKCNNMLGLAGDSIETLAKAIQYLGK